MDRKWRISSFKSVVYVRIEHKKKYWEDAVPVDDVLETQALCKQYEGYIAFSGVTLQVPKGAIYGLVGKNGAGKTALIVFFVG